MKKIVIYVFCFLGLVSTGAYFAFTTIKDTLWPPQATLQVAMGDKCALNALPKIPDVHITSVTIESEQAEHCKIAGVIEKEIRFELRLPNNWNGKFVMGGGGGFVGSVVNMAMLLGAVHSGYATVATDTGHAAHSLDATWALNNPDRIENFGHRAVHLTAISAKRLIDGYYGMPSTKNYFVGCSRGGGQALMEAQRYPGDFEGIVAGAPAYNWTAMAATAMQIARVMFPDPGNLGDAVIGPEQQTLVSKLYLEQCDHRDGLRDGILTNPDQCDFDVGALVCEHPKQTDCLTPQQATAMRTIYEGKRDELGELTHGFPLGGETSDAGMSLWMTGGLNGQDLDAADPQLDQDGYAAPKVPNALFGFGMGVMQNMIFSDPEWDYSTYSYKNYREDSADIAKILNATDPDLSSFRNRGGKLLMYHGWSDRALSANATARYFDQILSRDLSAKTDVRLYLMPGVDHCFGGRGPSFVNWLSVIDSWVTSGLQPEALEARWLKMNLIPYGSRLVCPYPQQLIYRSEGDPKEASSFSCQT